MAQVILLKEMENLGDVGEVVRLTSAKPVSVKNAVVLEMIAAHRGQAG